MEKYVSKDNLQYNIEKTKEYVNDAVSTKQDTLVSGTNIKTINNNSLLGSGNVAVTTYQAFNNSWTTDGTIAQLMADIENDNTAVVGMSYLGEVTCSDLPFNGNGELIISVMNNGNLGKVLLATLTSGNVSPYYWIYTYWNSQGSGWKSFIPSTSIDITPIQNSTNVLSSGGAYDAFAEVKCLIGSTAPTNSTVGVVGQFYLNTTTSKLYQCVGKTSQGGTPETFIYTWEETGSSAFKEITIASTTLTNDELALIQNNNCVLQNDLNANLITGTILTKPFEYGTTLRGLYISNSKIGTYLISTTTNEIGNGAQDIVLNNVAQLNGKGFPSYPADNTKTYDFKQVNGVLSWIEQINYGFKVISAPSSTTLTDDELTAIRSGCIINGSFLGYEKIVFMPSGEINYGEYDGLALIGNQLAPEIRVYTINATSKLISLSATNSLRIRLGSIAQINGKALPQYPSGNATYNLQQSNGTLQWNSAPDVASYNELGMVKLGSATQSNQAIETASSIAGRQYPVQVDANSRASVNVPWTDTTYTAGANITIQNNVISADTGLNGIAYREIV